MTIQTNEKRCVAFALQGHAIPPIAYGLEVARDGTGKFVPSVGGITYNVKIGDSVFGFESDHIEPGVSLIAGGFNDRRNANPNLSLNAYSCVGNTVTVLTGAAKGKKGYVVGHHGGVEHVIVDFPDTTLRRLTYSDQFLIEAHGQGLQLIDHDSIKLSSLSPYLLKKIPLKVVKNKIEIPVTACVPAKLMGSGLGHNDVFKGDYDIQTSDPEVLTEYKLNDLKLGDFVAIIDNEATFGWSYKTGAISIGVIVHGDSFLAGHGPGVQTLFTSRDGDLIPIIKKNANLGYYLKLGRYHKS